MKKQRIISMLGGVLVLTALGCAVPDSSQDESIEKYGQEFKGKIAKSYDESEEWRPSTPKHVIRVKIADTIPM